MEPRRPVAGCLLVDARLPDRTGPSPAATPERLAHLRARVVTDGRLPPRWPYASSPWFGNGAEPALHLAGRHAGHYPRMAYLSRHRAVSRIGTSAGRIRLWRDLVIDLVGYVAWAGFRRVLT